MKQHNEQFFYDLAQAYVEHDGKMLKELDLQEVDLHTVNLEKKVFHHLKQLKQKQQIRRLTYGLMPVAAILLVVIIYTAVFPILRQYDAFTNESRFQFATDESATEPAVSDMDEEEWAADDDTDCIWDYIRDDACADEAAEVVEEPADTLPMDSDDDADDAPLPEQAETEDDGADAGFIFSSTIEAIALPDGFQLVEKTILSDTEVSYTILSDTGHLIDVTETLITESWEWERHVVPPLEDWAHYGVQPLEEWAHYIAYFVTIEGRHILGFHLENVFLTLVTYDDYSALFLLREAIASQIVLP